MAEAFFTLLNYTFSSMKGKHSADKSSANESGVFALRRQISSNLPTFAEAAAPLRKCSAFFAADLSAFGDNSG
jgi:hypothetical protein